MLALYADEDSMSRRLVTALRVNGVDILTAAEAGRLRYADPQQLAFATEAGRTIYTANSGDFARLHRDILLREGMHAGITIRRRQRRSPDAQLAALLPLLRIEDSESMRNQVRWL